MKRHMPRHAVEQPLDQSYRIIPLTHGQNALVSTHRYELLNQYNWTAESDKQRKTYYAVRKEFIDGKWKRILMHRFILNDWTSPHIDHRNGNGIDNRDENLRPATNSQNGANCPMRVSNTTGFKGVYRIKNKFASSIKFQGKTISLGRFDTAESAAMAYDAAAFRNFGEFAQLNFPKHYLTKEAPQVAPRGPL